MFLSYFCNSHNCDKFCYHIIVNLAIAMVTGIILGGRTGLNFFCFVKGPAFIDLVVRHMVHRHSHCYYHKIPTKHLYLYYYCIQSNNINCNENYRLHYITY